MKDLTTLQINELNKVTWTAVGNYVENDSMDVPDIIVDRDDEYGWQIAQEIARRLNAHV